MEPHNHPDYEETLTRVATILDVLATDQIELQRSQTEFQRGMEQLKATIAQHIEHARERDEETTGKLNALIDLMNRHLVEDHGGK